VQEQIKRRRFTLRTLRLLRGIQIAAILPLVLTGSLMIHFDQLPTFGIVGFFLILIVGVIIPQMRGDMILSHFVLSKELEAKVNDLEERMVQLLNEQAG
jgi:uncharacterized membrane protein